MSHDSMLSTLIKHIVNNGFTSIKADAPKFESPAKISWKTSGESFIPDVTALLNQQGYIFEVETSESLSLQHTASQWRLFSTFSQEHGYTFVVVVPKSSEAVANALLKSIGAIAEVWTIT